MNLENEIFKLSCEINRNLKLSNSTVQFIIQSMSDFIKNTYNPILLQNFNCRLKNAVSKECMDVIKNILSEFEDSFQACSTEHRRLTIYKNKGLYVEPVSSEISTRQVIKLKSNKVFVGSKAITKVHLPLANSLQNIFKIEGLLDATLNNLKYLESEKHLIISLMNGLTWQEEKLSFYLEHGVDEILIPLLVYFDDLMVRNAFSAHAANNQLGCIYATVPCFPDSFASKLLSIIVTDLFYSKDRKTHGNEIILKDLLQDLDALRKKGLKLSVQGGLKKVYFATTLVIGDNLGINSLFGFTESFSNTIFCRICYVTSEDSKSMVKEDETLLRTVEKYEEDIKNLDPSSTGIKGSCPFNALKPFHAIKRPSLDLTHDGPEGVFNYGMAEVLLKLVEEEEITVELVNLAMNSIDFGFEKNNLPMDISFDYVKANKKLKMSASESMFFTRYFGMIVGEYISEGNPVWEFYIVLRRILDILTAPILTNSLLFELQQLIEQHHRMYLRLFGDLKPKHHLLLHYVMIIKQNGPVVKLSTLRFESKHREIKAITNAMASNVNIPLTVASRIQLSLLDNSSLKFEGNYITEGTEQDDDDKNKLFPQQQNKKCLEKATVNGYEYTVGTVIVSKILRSGLQFGKIDKVFIVNDEVHFRFVPMISTGFNYHLFGHSVIVDKDHTDMVSYDDLPCKIPCIPFFKKNTYVTTRHVIV